MKKLLFIVISVLALFFWATTDIEALDRDTIDTSRFEDERHAS